MDNNIKPKIALCVIAKDEGGTIGTMLESALPHVDALYLTDTGSKDKTIEVAKLAALKYNVDFHLTTFEWVDDFAAARNFNFSQVDEQYQWILWLDCDDTLESGENLQNLVATQKQNPDVRGFAFLYDYEHDENGRLKTVHWKERFLMNTKPLWFTWKGRVHEAVMNDEKKPIAKTEEVKVIHNDHAAGQVKSAERNIHIMNKMLEEETKDGKDPDPRTLFLMANAKMLTNEMVEAEAALVKYLELSGWDEERYQAMQLLGEICENHYKDFDRAITVYLNSMKERPDFPDAPFNLARAYHRKEDHTKTLFWTDIGYKRGRPDTNLIWFPQNYTWRPAIFAAYSAIQLGDMDLAMEYAQMANKHAPEDKYVQQLLGMTNHALGRRSVAEAYANIVKWMEVKGEQAKVPALLNILPNDHISDPIISRIKARYVKPKLWGDNTVVIYCPHTAEPFSPKSVDRGIGGSEEAVINLAKQWQGLGHEVTVYCWCDDEHGDYDGVTYKNYWEFNNNDHFNVIIGWRAPEFADAIQHKKKLFIDVHDVPQPQAYTKERLEKIDKIFVKTQYHREFLPDIPDEKFVIVGNGIDPTHFEGEVKRNPHKAFYSSSFDRGLEHLLHMWPLIRKEVTDAELHIFYGWDLFVKFHGGNPERMAWKDKIEELMKQDGIVYRGRVNHKDLAKEMMSSGAWLYPTDFEEIHCITACKAQAAGAIPVVSDYAALKETVRNSTYRIAGDPWSEEYRKKYVEQAIESLKNGDLNHREAMAEDAIETFNWEKVAKTWAGYFTN